MIPVRSCSQVRAHDQKVIDHIGIPGQQLMEVAGKGCAEIISQRWPRASVIVYCGPGNNGGDGYVIARWLHLWGHDVQLVQAEEARSQESQENARLCHLLGLQPKTTAAPATILVDALLGTGQQSAPKGAIARCVQEIKQRALSGVQTVAIDIPTGVCGATGQAFDPECVVRAHLTLSLGYLKTGLLVAPGLGLIGEVQNVDIGLDLAHRWDRSLETPEAWLLEQSDIHSWIPKKRQGDAKWNLGHVAVRAGGGAAVLAAHGAFRAGAGLVTIVAPRQEWANLHGLWPEVILSEHVDPLRHDVLVLGPGLGIDKVEDVLEHWTHFEGPLVADADALTILAGEQQAPKTSFPRVITPHSAEAARLLGQRRSDIERDRMSAVKKLSEWGLCVLKGPHTLISGPETWINPTGNASLATAGSGDVLAGHIGGYLARGVAPRKAVAVAVWRHGIAGERLPPNATASDLVDALR